MGGNRVASSPWISHAHGSILQETAEICVRRVARWWVAVAGFTYLASYTALDIAIESVTVTISPPTIYDLTICIQLDIRIRRLSDSLQEYAAMRHVRRSSVQSIPTWGLFR
jgi:hypothetical protein